MSKNLVLAGILLLSWVFFLTERSGWNATSAQREAGAAEGSGNVMPLPQSLQGQPAVRQPEAAAPKTSQVSPPAQASQTASAAPGTQSAQQPQQLTPLQSQSTTGMQMPMMCGMGSMGNMGGMSNMGSSSMSHNMDQGLTMREILYIVSMQDTLQAMQDMVRIQEKLLAGVTVNDREAIRKEMDQVNDRLKKLASDYRGIITSQVRGE